MDLQPNTIAYLRYHLQDFEGNPITGLTYTQVYWYHCNASGTTMTLRNLAAGDFATLGEGHYRIKVPASLTGELGVFTTRLYAGGGLPSIREDMIGVTEVAGTGYARTFTAEDADEDPIPSVLIQVRNSTGMIVIAEGETDTNGEWVQLLPAGDYLVYAWRAGFSFSGQPYSLTVAADGTATYTGEAFVPSDPGDPDMVTVYGWLLAADGNPRVGVSVTFAPILEDQEILRPLASDAAEKLLSRVGVAVTTNAEGYFEVSLIPSSDIEPAGTQYKVTISDDPEDHAAITIPDAGPVNIESLI